MCVEGVIWCSSSSTSDGGGKQSLRTTVLQGNEEEEGLPTPDLCYCSGSSCALLASCDAPPHPHPAAIINHPFASAPSALLPCAPPLLCLFLLAVAPLLSRRALLQTASCLRRGRTNIVPARRQKTFHRLSHFQRGLPYRYNWALPAAEVLGRHNEGEKEKEKKNRASSEEEEEEAEQGSGSASSRSPFKYLRKAPPLRSKAS